MKINKNYKIRKQITTIKQKIKRKLQKIKNEKNYLLSRFVTLGCGLRWKMITDVDFQFNDNAI
jgi:hypothetical protein